MIELKKMNPVPVKAWGKDHWSTLAYLETREVDHKGKINNDQMRVNPRKHRALTQGRVKAAISYADWKDAWSTRLRGHTEEKPRQIKGHDDWHCVEDMIVAGYVRIISELHKQDSGLFGSGNVTISLTEKGRKVASWLRKHKASGGTFASFVPYRRKGKK